MKFNVFFFLFLATCTAVSLSASADEPVTGSRQYAMIELGSGVETAVNRGGVNILMRVGFGWVDEDPDVPGDPHEPEQLIWAHITGDFAFGTVNRLDPMPYMNIEFSPVHQVTCVRCPRDKPVSVLGELHGLPMSVTRDVRLGQQATYQVDIVGVSFEGRWRQSQHVALFGRIAAEVLGYQLAVHAENSTFHGVHVAGLAGQIGALFDINDDARIRVALGGDIDLALGGSDGFSAYSDMSAYLMVQAELFQHFNIFLRGGVNAMGDSGNDLFNGSGQIIAGISVDF